MFVRKFKLLVIVMAMISMGAIPGPSKLKRLTVENHSERAIEISLSGRTWEKSYYLRVPAGTAEFPAEKAFTIYPDFYSGSVHYVEYWDPVYGYDCNNRGASLDLTHNAKLVVPECNKPQSHGRGSSGPSGPPGSIETLAPQTARGWGREQPD
jgi:hypothetical protein